MASSGLIYAAIVAGWAAVLVPRWVRRNEEIEQAREADQARGVRVLEPSASTARGVRTQARHQPAPITIDEPLALVDEPVETSGDGQAARRRRRVLMVLVLALVAVTVTAVIGTVPLWSVAIPALLLSGFLRLAHRAAAAEAARPRVQRRRPGTGDAMEATSRVRVLEEPEPVEPVDPRAWEPVPVPLPTYLTKDKAPDTATRTIDLTQPGAWTSARLQPAGSITPPRPVSVPQAVMAPVEDGVEELPEHRPAVGD
jgi:hypothetical protein